jgi:nucleotide-binding universal stress UspA family protein
MKKILVPTDFSKEATKALDLAYELAKKKKAEILLLNVVEYPSGDSFNTMGVQQVDPMANVYIVKMMDSANEKMDAVLADTKYADVEMSKIVVVGHPFSHISNAVAKQDVDLVIIGSTGTSGMAEQILGSNAEKVVRHSQCPVITVKNNVNPYLIKDIVFATDLSDSEEIAWDKIKDLQKMFGATLHLLRVNTPNNFTPDNVTIKKMKSMAEKHGFEDYKLHIFNHHAVEDGILYFAEQIDADMIAMVTHGRTGFMHLITGSLTEDLVNQAKRPVWTFNLKAVK